MFRSSSAKVGLAVFGGILILVVFLVSVKSCTVTKKEVSNVDSTKSQVGTNIGDNKKESSKTEGSKKEVNTTTEQSSVGGAGFREVEAPKVGGSTEVSVMVSSKKSYLVGNGYYIYSISLVFPSNNDSLITVDYFCSRKVYDSLKIGDTVMADYSKDSKGYISINGISR